VRQRRCPCGQNRKVKCASEGVGCWCVCVCAGAWGVAVAEYLAAHHPRGTRDAVAVEGLAAARSEEVQR
jgi:hypothetical protein